MNSRYRGIGIGLVLGFLLGIVVFTGVSSYHQSKINTDNLVLESIDESDVLSTDAVLSDLAVDETPVGELSIREMSTNELWALRKFEASTLPDTIKVGTDKILDTEESVNDYLDNNTEKLILDGENVYYLKVFDTFADWKASNPDLDIFIEGKDGDVDFSGYVSCTSCHRIGDGEKFLASYS